jgi:uncharacterized tellurite resistance protein B-like protein
MFNQLLKQIASAIDPSNIESTVSPRDIERVSATLLVEIARADHDIRQDERDAIFKALAATSSLAAPELNELVDEALANADNTISLHAHVSLINEAFNGQDKVALVEQMWRVAFADGNVDGYEEYTIRKLCDLLYVRHRDYMQAKLKVAAESK